jgi:hypothetical protein
MLFEVPAEYFSIQTQDTGAADHISKLSHDTSGNLRIEPPSGTGIKLGGNTSAAIKGHFVGSTTWDPASVADGDDTFTNVTVTGCTVGMPASVSLTTLGTNDVLITGHVTAADNVRVVMLNRSGGSLDLASGTLRATCWTY